MKAIRKTMGLIVTQSPAMLISVILISIIFMIFQYNLYVNKPITAALFFPFVMINITLSVLVGVYLGGGLKGLQQNYLWTINQHYRTVLIAAFLILAGLYTLMLMPILYLAHATLSVYYLLPFSIIIFSSHMVIGENLWHKIIIPAVPFGLYQLTRIGISMQTIVILIVVCSVVVIYVMYRNYFVNDKQQSAQDNQESMAVAATGLNLKWVTAFNYFLGLIINKWISMSKKNIDWAIIMPHTKLALFSLLYVIIIMAFVLLNNEKNDRPLLEPFSIMFIASSFISLIMESRQLIRQTRTFAHLYSGQQNRQLKNKILWSLDKMYVVNTVVFALGIFFSAYAFSIKVNVNFLLMSLAAVMLFAISFYPVLLRMKWLNISFTLLASILVYAGVIFFIIKWLRNHMAEGILYPQIILFISACVLLRAVSQYLLWHYPYEKLLINK